MSEIRSISEGTFVIGDTNGLTFEAGPGISVSQPSEGTVRIANDETVLWENESSPLQTSGGTAVLSEDPSVFKYLRFEYRGEQSSYYGVKTSTVYNDGNLSSICVGGLAQLYDNYAFSFTGAHISITGTTLTLVRQGRFNVNDNDTISATDHGNGMFKLVRVVGINRKANA